MRKLWQHWKQFLIPLGLAGLLIFGTTRQVQAAEIIQTGVVPAKEVIDDDAFVSGQNVVVDGTVNGALFAAGEDVLINGTVNGDAFIAGKTLTISKTAQIHGNLFLGGEILQLEGSVTGSMFAGGMAATLGKTAQVGRNLYYGGYSLEMEKGAAIARDLYSGGYQLLLAGEVGRDVNASVAALQLTGQVAGNLNADVSSSTQGGVPMKTFYPEPGVPDTMQPGLRISPDATVGGKLVYTSPVEQKDTIQSSPAGGVVYQTPVPDQNSQAAAQKSTPGTLAWVMDRIRDLIIYLIFGVLVIWLAPKWLSEGMDMAQQKWPSAAGTGFLALIAGYAGSFLGFLIIFCTGLFLAIVTLGGLSATVFGVGFSGLGLAFALFLLLVNYVSKILAASLAGRLILEKLTANRPANPFLSLVIGVVLFVLVSSIPVIGWIISFLFTITGLGAIWMIFRNHTRKIEPLPEMPPAREGLEP